MSFYDWEGTSRTSPVGTIYSARESRDATRPGLVIGHENNSHLALVYQEGGSNYAYIDFDKDKILKDENNYPIKFRERAHFDDTINIDGDIYTNYSLWFGSSATAGIYAGVNQYLALHMDYNGLIFNNRSGTNVLSYERADADWNFWRNVYMDRNLTVIGSKNSLQETENYGRRLINAYETAEYYFGDIGSGIINKNGECVVYIDDIFQECINTNIAYHVFTQVYNGNITKIERLKNYFIVYGEKGTEFSWELKAKRKGYEHNRLEYMDQFHESEIPSFDRELEEKETQEDIKMTSILETELIKDLSKILLQED